MGNDLISAPSPFVGIRSSERIADALRAARQHRGLTQAELAEAAGVSREALSHIENGRSARTETLNSVLDVLDYELAFLPRDTELDVTITANRLACYVPDLRDYDDEFRLRVILHDFGLVWQHASLTERVVLVAEEPKLFDLRWDAFLAAYTEHLCYHAEVDVPDWVQADSRYLPWMWWACEPFEFERGSIILKTPAAFEVHGIWIDERELQVV